MSGSAQLCGTGRTGCRIDFTPKQSELRMSVIAPAKRPSSAPYGCTNAKVRIHKEGRDEDEKD